MDVFDALYILALLLANGFFVAAEFALVKVRVSQIDQMAEKGHLAARLTSRALDRLDAYLSASQLGITVASLALGNAIHDKVEPSVIRIFSLVGLDADQDVTGAIATIVPLLALCLVTFLHMAIGEQAPKTLAIRSPRIVALITAPILVIFTYIFWPIIWLLNSASHLTLFLLGLGYGSHAEVAHTEEEVRVILGESTEGGFLTRVERLMIENVLNLEHKSARSHMIPRTRIVYLSLSRPLEENLRLARQAGHTRYPVCEDDISTVIGMIHVKDLFRAGTAFHSRADLLQLKRPVPFISDNISLDKLLQLFLREKVHLAVVLDEHGDVEGMVTLENVLEELVGPIQDEFDREWPHVVALPDGNFEVDGTCPLEILHARCGVEIPTTYAETANGLMVEILGRIATTGDTISLSDHQLTVLEADPTLIRKILVKPPAPASP